MAKRLSEEEKLNIIAVVATGRSYREAAKQFGVSVGTISSICTAEKTKLNKTEHKKRESVQIDIVERIEGEYGNMYELLSKLLRQAGKDEAIESLNSVSALKAAGILIDKMLAIREFKTKNTSPVDSAAALDRICTAIESVSGGKENE